MNRRSTRYQIIITTKVWADEVFADVVQANSRKVDAIKRAKQMITTWGKDAVKIEVKDTGYGIINPIIWSWTDEAWAARQIQITDVKEMARCNAGSVEDEIHAYGGRDAAIDAFHINLIDTMVEMGHKDDAEMFDIAERAFWKVLGH